MDRRQQKLEKKKKKRELVAKRKRALAAARPSLEERTIALAAKGPFGRCFVSEGWNIEDADGPRLVTVIVTRLLPDGEAVPMVMLVDRTCLGVKSAFVVPPSSQVELEDLVEHVGEPHGGMSECSPLVAQSIVFHALDYAARLGFEPDADLRLALLEPRPAELVETPWRRLERPLYAPGPDDDASTVMNQLSEKVGIGNWDLLMGGRVIAGRA